jgi:pyridoxal 5'-phosphate synthase pdxS subunit
MRQIKSDMRLLTTLGPEELMTEAKDLGAPITLVRYVAEHGCLPVPLFAAGGIATPADVSLMMQLGAQTVFVGSGIFKSANPAKRARAMVLAATHYQDPAKLAEISEDLGEPMVGINCDEMIDAVEFAERGV